MLRYFLIVTSSYIVENLYSRASQSKSKRSILKRKSLVAAAAPHHLLVGADVSHAVPPYVVSLPPPPLVVAAPPADLTVADHIVATSSC